MMRLRDRSLVFLALLAPAGALATGVGDGNVQGTLNRMHEVNERGLIQGQQENLKVKTQVLQNRENLDQSFYDQQAKDAHIPGIESKLSNIEVQQRALDSEKKQLNVAIPPPAPIRPQLPPAAPAP